MRVKNIKQSNLTIFADVPSFSHLKLNELKNKQTLRKRGQVFANKNGRLSKRLMSLKVSKSIKTLSEYQAEREKADQKLQEATKKLNFVFGKDIQNWKINFKSEKQTIFNGSLLKLIYVKKFEEPVMLDSSIVSNSNYYDIDKTGKMFKIRPEDRVFRRDYIRANKSVSLVKRIGDDALKKLIESGRSLKRNNSNNQVNSSIRRESDRLQKKKGVLKKSVSAAALKYF